MSNPSADAMLDYFELYRQKKREQKELVDEITRMRGLLEKKQQEYQKMGSEIRSMQRIITTMIDENMDPVEVKLKNDVSTMFDSMWSERDGEIADEVTLTITGATGAIGAIGHNTISKSLMYPYVDKIASKYSLINTGTV